MNTTTLLTKPFSWTKLGTKSGGSQKTYLFGPRLDFLGLGGLSLLVILFFGLVPEPELIKPQVAMLFFIATQFINHPHFAHSYQIFYRDFGRKIGEQTGPELRYRYWFAGIIAPLVIGLYYSFALWNGDTRLIGYSINVMGFLVGWHYVKQGYGMLSVQSVLQRKFFTDGEKKLLLYNAYAGWAYSWVFGNRLFAEKDFWGVGYYTFGVPDSVHMLTLGIMVVMTTLTLIMFVRRMLPGGNGLPLIGVMAYLTSIYIWRIVLEINPLYAFAIPAFHSLQYLVVVWRFQLNVETENVENGATTRLSYWIPQAAIARLVRFYVIGLLLGALAFWGVPALLTLTMDEASAASGFFWPFAVVWVFINVHHYLLDNVMWRKGNPDVSKHLFNHTA